MASKTPFGAKIFGVVMALLLLGILVSCVQDLMPKKTSVVKQEATPAAQVLTSADKVVAAVAPTQGELLMPPSDTDPKKYVLERILDAGEKFGVQNQQVSRSGDLRAMPYSFSDGSVLTVYGLPVGSQQGLFLDRIEVTRP